MHRLRDWARHGSHRHASDRDKSKGGANGDLAVAPSNILPNQRQYQLTPSPSNDDISILQPLKCMFFNRVPLELRQQIYRAAFGDRIVYLDIAHDTFGCDVDDQGRIYALSSSRRWKMSRTNSAWLWWEGLCHWHPKVPPFLNHCHDPMVGYFAPCPGHPYSPPNFHKIGIIGWLLACRQAYAEGIEVLYRHNTIYINRVPLMLHIDSLILSQRLRGIVSLKIKWSDFLGAPSLSNAEAGQESNDSFGVAAFRQKTWTNLDTFLNKIPLLFPALRHFFFSMAICAFGPYNIELTGPCCGDYALRIFDSIDLLVFSLSSSLQECYVAFPHCIYDPVKPEAWEAESSAKIYPRMPHEGMPHPFPGFWRNIVGGEVEGTGKLGYWVVDGEIDPPS